MWEYEPLARVVGVVYARLQSDESLSGYTESGIDRPSLSKELMETKRQDRVAFARLDEIEIYFADPE